MRGAIIKTFGEPSDVLELVDVPEPTRPAEGEVLVGVEYAPVNMNDLYVIQGAFPVRQAADRFRSSPRFQACRGLRRPRPARWSKASRRWPANSTGGRPMASRFRRALPRKLRL